MRPTTSLAMRSTQLLRMRATTRVFAEVPKPSSTSWPMYRKNNVPHWQRLHQKDDGVRQWWKGPRAKYMLYPYYAMVWGGFTASMYMMVRMIFGHKTWFSEG